MAGSRREIIKAKQRVFEDWGIKWDAAIQRARAVYAEEREVRLILLVRFNEKGKPICRIKCPINPLPIEVGEMTADDLACKKYKAHYDVLRMHERTNVLRELKSLKANAIPTEYDILACVEKYSYDSFSDFCAEFGYSTDSISARETFLACGEEYAGLRRIFTEEQMEKMREIY